MFEVSEGLLEIARRFLRVNLLVFVGALGVRVLVLGELDQRVLCRGAICFAEVVGSRSSAILGFSVGELVV